MVACRTQRVVHSFNHRDRLAATDNLNDLLSGKRPETANVQTPRQNPFFFAEVIDCRLGRFHIGSEP